MLSTQPNDLAQEVRAAVERLEKMRPLWEELLRLYHGRAWGGDDEAELVYQRHVYEYVSLLLPKLVTHNPRFSLSTTRGGRQAVVTRALERGLNHWAVSSKLHESLEEIALDTLLLMGCAYIEEVPTDKLRVPSAVRERMKGSHRKSKGAPHPEDMDKPHWPRVRRLQPFRYFWDLSAPSEDQVRFSGHKVTEDKNDLIARAKAEGSDWDLKAIESLNATEDHRELGHSPSRQQVPNRKQVTYYVVWIPDARIEGKDPEDDEHGVIYTIATEVSKAGDVSGKFLRKPYYFYGPSEGPYVRCGALRVPESTIPLSSPVAIMDSMDVLGRVHSAIVKRIERYKRGLLYDLHDVRDMERIRDSQDDDLIGITEFQGNATSFETGGATAQDLEHHAWLRERLESASGMDDVQRGNVTGQGTATEVALAAEGSSERTGFLISKWRQFVAECAMRVAWYAAHDDRIVFTYRVDEDQREAVAEEAKDAGMMTGDEAEHFMRYGSMVFEGGDFASGSEHEDELSFGDLAFDVEPYSMQRRDQRSMKMDTVEALNLLATFGAAATQGVPLDLGKVAQILADRYAMPELEEVVNRDVAQAQGILAMEERVAAMQSDTTASEGAESRPARGTRSERAKPPGQPQARVTQETM